MIVLLDRDFSVIEHLGSEARINKIEDLEGEKTIKVEYPLNLSDGIKVRRLFWYDKGVYRITKVKVDLDKIIAECDHVFYEIARERPKTVTYTHITARLGMEMALTGSMWQVGEVWTTALRTTDKFEDKNPLALLTEVAKAWGGELDFRVELSNSGQLSFFVDLLQRRGSFKGDRIEIGYNLEGIQYEEDTESIITALVARGNTGEMDANGNMGYFDFKDVEWSIAKGDPVNKPLGQDWIGDHEALEVYGTMDLSGTKRHIFDLYVSEAKTSQELINATWLILNRRNKPRVNIEAKVKMLPADDIKLGDTVFVITERDRVEARVVRVSEVDGEPENTTVELGNYRRNVMDRMIEVEHIAIELKRKEGVYDRASFFVPTDGGTEYILDIGEKNIRIVGDTNFYWDGSGFFTVNPNNPNEYMRNDKDGIRFTKDGGVTWGTAIDYNGMRVGKNTIFEEGYDPTQIDFESMTEEEVTVIAENYIKTANVIAQNLKVKSANIDGRLTANQITVGSTTTFATNYDPTSKETPTGAQTKATNALNSAKAYTDGAITTYDGNLKTHLETEFSVRDGEILLRVTQQELQTVDNKFSSYSTTSQMNSAINVKAGEILSSVSESYSTKGELGTLGDRVTSAEQKITPNAIITTVRDRQEYKDDLASKNKIFIVTPTPPYSLGDMWITGTIVRRCSTAKASGGAYALGDWTQINNRVFTSTPVPPYIVGDLWVQGDTESSEVMRCNVARASGSYVVADWVKATGYGSRLTSAESKITPTAIINTVRERQEYKDDLGTKLNTLDLGTEIRQRVSDVRIAVGQVGGKNLLRKSNVPVTTTTYHINNWILNEPIALDEEVTLSIKGTLGADRQYFGIYNSGGSVECTTVSRTDLGSDGVFRKTFKWKVGASTNTFLTVYHMMSTATSSSTIQWIQLERGGVATDWTPAISEMKTMTATFDDGGLVLEKGAFRQKDEGGVEFEITSKTNLVHDHSFELLTPSGSVGIHDDFPIDAPINQGVSFTGWLKSGDPRLISDYNRSSFSHTAIFGLQAVACTSANQLVRYFFVRPNTTYTMSAYAYPHYSRNTFNSTVRSYFWLAFYNSNVTHISSASSVETLTTAFSVNNNQKLSMKRHTYTFTTPSTATIIGIVLGSPTASEWVIFDGIQVVEGTRPVYYESEDNLWAMARGEGYGGVSMVNPTIVGNPIWHDGNNQFQTSVNGGFIRFSNRMQICWQNIDFVNVGAMYTEQNVWWFPASFSGVPTYQSANLMSSRFGSDMFQIRLVQSTQHSATIGILSTQVTNNMKIGLLAIGRW